MNRVSSLRGAVVVLLLPFLPGGVAGGVASGVANTISVQSTTPAKRATGAPQAAGDPQKLFEAGEAALRAGKLDEAEREFRQVLVINPGVAGADGQIRAMYLCRAQRAPALPKM